MQERGGAPAEGQLDERGECGGSTVLDFFFKWRGAVVVFGRLYETLSPLCLSLSLKQEQIYALRAVAGLGFRGFGLDPRDSIKFSV